MRKIFTVIILCTLFTTASIAQVQVGLKAGVNLANQSSDSGGDNEISDSYTGFHAGGVVGFKLSDSFVLQGELLYNVVGAEYIGEKLEMTYFSIPVLLKFQFLKFLDIHAGPQFGFLTKAEYAGVDVKDAYSGSDFGFAVGAGAELLRFKATLRYIAGINNIADSGSDLTTKNNVFQISLGFRLVGGR